MIIKCVIDTKNDPTTYIPRHFLERTPKELQAFQPVVLIVNGGSEQIVVNNLISRSMYPGLDKTYIELDINSVGNTIKVGDYLKSIEWPAELVICEIIKT